MYIYTYVCVCVCVYTYICTYIYIYRANPSDVHERVSAKCSVVSIIGNTQSNHSSAKGTRNPFHFVFS